MLSNNIANADTPGFKAKDIDFGQHWVGNWGSDNSEQHMTSTGKALATQTTAKFSRFYNPSIDGNTVEIGLRASEVWPSLGRVSSDFGFSPGAGHGLQARTEGD